MFRILALLFCLLLFFQDKVLSSEEISNIPCQISEGINCKVYVKSSQIYFSNDKIFILIDKNMMEIDFISKDDNGLYGAVRVKGYPKSWICPICSEHNENRDYCHACGYWPRA